MGTKDARIDAYIAKSADFARPILKHLRAQMHAHCPEVAETIKWSMPFYEYKGGVFANMAAFKQHCAFGFWKGREAGDSDKTGEAMGQFGRITGPADLPGAREFKAQVKAAIARSDAAAAAPPAAKPRRAAKPVPPLPADLAQALAAQAKVKAVFDAMPPSHRREYIEWVLDAKREETRAKRIAQTVERVAAGQSINARYAT